MAPETDPTPEPELLDMDRRRDQRAALRSRHASGVSSLMTQREDLRGVHPLADLVADAVRWTA